MSMYRLKHELLSKDATTEKAPWRLFQMRDLRRGILRVSLSHQEGSQNRSIHQVLQHEVLRQDRRQESISREAAQRRFDCENEGTPQSKTIRCRSWKSKLHSVWNRVWIQRKSGRMVEAVFDAIYRQVRTMRILRQKSIEPASQGQEQRKQCSRESRTDMLELSCD